MRLLLALALATTASALHETRARSMALRGGSDEEGLFGGEPVDDDDDEETKASKRYAAAVAQLRKEGGECAALDEFEAESLKSDRDESKLAVLWMDVKLQNLQKKRPEDYTPGDAAHAYARGVAFLATECGAYVEAEKMNARWAMAAVTGIVTTEVLGIGGPWYEAGQGEYDLPIPALLAVQFPIMGILYCCCTDEFVFR